MIECYKRQTTVNRADKSEKYRCMNKKSGLFGQHVTESDCANCPMPAQRKKKPCDDKPVTTKEVKGVSDDEIKELMEAAGLEAEEVDIDYPEMSLQLWLYKEALVRWNKAGRPTRSKEQVERIHDTYCANPTDPCNYYDPEKRRCKDCGCRVTTGSIAVVNKIKMATEHCPKGKW